MLAPTSVMNPKTATPSAARKNEAESRRPTIMSSSGANPRPAMNDTMSAEGVASADDRLRGDDRRLRPGDHAGYADLIAEHFVEKGEAFQVFERRRLPHEGDGEIFLRALADSEIRADGRPKLRVILKTSSRSSSRNTACSAPPS